jgi:hypothetical protein
VVVQVVNLFLTAQLPKWVVQVVVVPWTTQHPTMVLLEQQIKVMQVVMVLQVVWLTRVLVAVVAQVR